MNCKLLTDFRPGQRMSVTSRRGGGVRRAGVTLCDRGGGSELAKKKRYVIVEWHLNNSLYNLILLYNVNVLCCNVEKE